MRRSLRTWRPSGAEYSFDWAYQLAPQVGTIRRWPISLFNVRLHDDLISSIALPRFLQLHELFLSPSPASEEDLKSLRRCIDDSIFIRGFLAVAS